MENIKRKNSLWQLYGILSIVWVLYSFLLLIEDEAFSLVPIIVLIFFSLIILFSQWSSTVEVIFSTDFLEVRHYFKSQSKKCDYSNIKSVEHIFTRVYGRRLIFKCYDFDNESIQFTIYNPDSELLQFVSNHIRTYNNRVI